MVRYTIGNTLQPSRLQMPMVDQTQDSNLEDNLRRHLQLLLSYLTSQESSDSSNANATATLSNDFAPYPSIATGLYYYISLAYVVLIYVLIPLIFVIYLICSPKNRILIQKRGGWLDDAIELDQDLQEDDTDESGEMKGEVLEGENAKPIETGRVAEGQEQKEERKGQTSTKVKRAMKSVSVAKTSRAKSMLMSFANIEVFLARNGVLIAFCLMALMGITLLLLYGVLLETVLYQDKANLLLAVAIPIGRGCGVVTNFTFTLLLLFMCRLPLTWLSNTPLNLFLPFESNFELHIWFAVFTLFMGTIHGLLQTVNFLTNPVRTQTWDSVANHVSYG